MVDKKKIIDPLLEDEDESGGSTGAAGQIEFHDFLAPRSELSPDELKRLLSANADLQEAHVIKQKDKADQLKALKEGKINYQQYQQGLAAGGGGSELAAYPPHPDLMNSVQFAGIEKEENPLANINEAETNPENRNELTNEYRLTHQPEMRERPVFNPKPKMS